MKQQSKKNRQERIASEPLFGLLNDVQIVNKEILLIDDLLTTGTTLKHAKQLLLEAGAKKVDYIILLSNK